MGVVYPSYPAYSSATYVVSPSVVSGYYGSSVLSTPVFTDEVDTAPIVYRSSESDQVLERGGSGETLQPLLRDETQGRSDTPADVPDAKLNRWMMEGAEAFGRGRYNDAALSFLRVAMADPSNADGTLAYAVARFATGNYGVAALAVRRGVLSYPEVVNVDFDIRDRYDERGDFDRQLRRLEEFVRTRPDSADSWLVLGFVRYFTGQRELAQRTFEVLQRQSAEDAELADLFLDAVRRGDEQPASGPVHDEG